MKASANPSLDKITSDPTLVCTGFKKNRFYLFTKREPDQGDRLVLQNMFSVLLLTGQVLPESLQCSVVMTNISFLTPCIFYHFLVIVMCSTRSLQEKKWWQPHRCVSYWVALFNRQQVAVNNHPEIFSIGKVQFVTRSLTFNLFFNISK